MVWFPCAYSSCSVFCRCGFSLSLPSFSPFSLQVSGFPLNVPFVDLDTIVEAVFSTGVHSQDTSDIEFALAVYVHGYSNSVLSIWIYVASLVRLR